MATPAARSAGASAPPGAGFNFLGIALMAAVAGLGLAYGIDALARSGEAVPVLSGLEDGPPVENTIAGLDLSIPAGWLRDQERHEGGFTERIDLDLVVAFPGLDAPAPVAVTLQPRSRARASAHLLDAVYLHLFEPGQVEGAPGLVGKPLRPVAGYQGETVWYDPLSANPFTAKCGAPVADVPTQCVRTVLLQERIAATYVFGEELLPAWRGFDAAMMAVLAPAGLGPAGPD